MDVQSSSSQATPPDTFSSSRTTDVNAPHLHGPPRPAAQHRRLQIGAPYIILGNLTLAELMRNKQKLKSAINGIDQGIETILAETGGCPDEECSKQLNKMRTELSGHKAHLAKVRQTIERVTSNTNGVPGRNLVDINTIATAGQLGVIQGAGAFQQPQPSTSPAPNGMNPGGSGPSTAVPQITPWVSDEQSGMPSTPQGAFPNQVPTAGPSIAPAPQAQASMMPDGMRPPQIAKMKPVIQSGPILPPTEEQFSQARVAIQKMKQVFSSYGLVELQQQVVADDQQMEYDELLQQVHKITRRLDEKLPLYWITLKSDDVIRELVAIVLMVERQWERCSRGSPRFIIGLHTLKNMSIQLRKSIKVFEQRHPMITTAVASQQMGDGLTGHRPSSITAPNIPPSAQLTPRQTNQSLTPSVALSKIRPKILIPDLTGLITRCNKDPVSGGAYGNIYNCIYHGPDGDVEVAVKAIRSQFFSAKALQRELGIWKRLRHCNILKLMGTTSDFGPSAALVAPWIVNGTLTSFLNHNNETLTLLERLFLLRDTAAGLNYLHTFSFTEDGHTTLNPVVHGDLTGNNVLISGDKKAYLADFGLSGTLHASTGMTYLAKMSHCPGAVRWTAPELLSEDESASAVTTQSDIYSLGSIMLQVLTGNVPWRHLTKEGTIAVRVYEGTIHPRPDDERISDQHWNFMVSCWSRTPNDRPSAKEALQFVVSQLSLL